MAEPQQDINLNYPSSITTSSTAIREYDYTPNNSNERGKAISNNRGVSILKSVYRSLILSNKKNKKLLKNVFHLILYI